MFPDRGISLCAVEEWGGPVKGTRGDRKGQKGTGGGTGGESRAWKTWQIPDQKEPHG